MQVVLNINPIVNIGECLYYISEGKIITLVVVKFLIDDIEVGNFTTIYPKIGAYLCLNQNGLLEVITPEDIRKLEVVTTKQALLKKIENLCPKKS